MNGSTDVGRIGFAARPSGLFRITEFLGVPRCSSHPLRTTKEFLPTWKALNIPTLRTYPNVFLSVLFLPPPPSLSHFLYLYQHLYNFLCVHFCFSPSLSSFRFGCLLFLRGSLPLFLSSSLLLFHHRSPFLGRFPFFCLWPCFLPSCRKAINPAGPAAGSRQSLGSRSWGRGLQGGGDLGKLGHCCYSRGGGRQKRAKRCHSQKATTAASTACAWTPILQGTDTWPSFHCEPEYLGPSHILPKP